MKPKMVNVGEAKAHLPELIERAANGETFVLARHGKPRARLVPLEQPKPRRMPGKNRFGLKPGWEKKWDALDAQVLELFYGSTKCDCFSTPTTKIHAA
jgi:prevent-host-death family protein